MADLRDDFSDLTRKNLSLIVRRLGEVGQNNVAEHLGVTDSKITDMKRDGKELPQLAKLLSFCGLQVRSVDDRCFTPEEIQTWDFLAEIGRKALLKYPRMGDVG